MPAGNLELFVLNKNISSVVGSFILVTCQVPYFKVRMKGRDSNGTLAVFDSSLDVYDCRVNANVFVADRFEV